MLSGGAELRPSAWCDQGPIVTLPFDAEKAAASGGQRLGVNNVGCKHADGKSGRCTYTENSIVVKSFWGRIPLLTSAYPQSTGVGFDGGFRRLL